MKAECIACGVIKELSSSGWCESCSRKLDRYIESTGDDEGYFENEEKDG